MKGGHMRPPHFLGSQVAFTDLFRLHPPIPALLSAENHTGKKASILLVEGGKKKGIIGEGDVFFVYA